MLLHSSDFSAKPNDTTPPPEPPKPEKKRSLIGGVGAAALKGGTDALEKVLHKDLDGDGKIGGP